LQTTFRFNTNKTSCCGKQFYRPIQLHNEIIIQAFKSASLNALVTGTRLDSLSKQKKKATDSLEVIIRKKMQAFLNAE